jgi:undecaprenyl-diphosphatase
MQWWQALILGIVEGITEYLPVSSTGHLIFTSWLLGFGADAKDWEAVNTFNIVIQAGAIAAVGGLYWRRLRQMAMGLLGRDATGLRLTVNLMVAFMPAAILGLLLHDHIKQYLFGPWPVVAALFVGAWLMLAVARSRRINPPADGRGVDDLTWRFALLIGIAQCVAMWPGTSRSMMTIVAAMMLGLRVRDAAEFSFLLGLITLTAATGYEAVDGGAAMLEQIGVGAVAIGFIAATVSAILAVKWMLAFLTRRGLGPFGWYRLAIASVLAALLVSGVM